MKHLVLIIHDNLKMDIADLFRNMEKVQGFTFSSAEGHSVQMEEDAFLSARDKVEGYTPRVRVDLILEDQNVPQVLTELRKSNIGLEKHGVYWITTVEEYGHL